MNKNLNLKKSIALASMLLFALIITACGPSANNTTNTNTGSNTTNANSGVTKLACDDTQVIKDIIATIEAKYPLLKARMDHLNAYSKGCSVTLTGYTDTLVNFKDFYKVASETPNVVKVNIDNLFLERSEAPIKNPDGECPVGMVPCGDLCVPEGQCWTKNLKQTANGNTNTNTNANSNSNSNARSKP